MTDGDGGVGERARAVGNTDRRTVLRGALIAGVATPLLAACGSNKDQAAAGDGGGSSGGSTLASTSDIKEGGGEIFADEGVVVTQPKAGEFKGFTNICTHMGCPLHDVTSTINCNCHGSQFSISDGSVVNGPATSPLPTKAIKVKGTNISLG